MGKGRSPSIRFLTSSTLRLETGQVVTAGPRLDRDAARAAAPFHRVLLHHYPRTEDISADPARTAEALSGVRTDGELFSFCARIFSDGTTRVLVLDHLH